MDIGKESKFALMFIAATFRAESVVIPDSPAFALVFGFGFSVKPLAAFLRIQPIIKRLLFFGEVLRFGAALWFHADCPFLHGWELKSGALVVCCNESAFSLPVLPVFFHQFMASRFDIFLKQFLYFLCMVFAANKLKQQHI